MRVDEDELTRTVRIESSPSLLEKLLQVLYTLHRLHHSLQENW